LTWKAFWEAALSNKAKVCCGRSCAVRPTELARVGLPPCDDTCSTGKVVTCGELGLPVERLKYVRGFEMGPARRRLRRILCHIPHRPGSQMLTCSGLARRNNSFNGTVRVVCDKLLHDELGAATEPH